jgi:sporulation protein YlmC with PRC-barrel domain
MLKLKNLTETYGMRVYTDAGEYFGDVEEAMVQGNKIFGWKVRATRDSYLAKTIGGAKGVIVPHQLVRAIGDIMIISRAVIPSFEEKTEE